jgi:hypothetical protein
MAIDGRRVRSRLGALLLVALLAVPLVASGHAHRDQRSAATCAVCIAAHHTPSVTTPPAGFAPPATPAVVVVLAAERPACGRPVSAALGRAPPVTAIRPV